MKRVETAKFGIAVFLLAVVVIGGTSVPTLQDQPPDTWVVIFGLTCIALGLLVGFGMREILMPDDDE